MQATLKIAVQKSGRLKDGSIDLLRECGIYIDNGKDQLKATASNFPIEILFLRNSDIPAYVNDGVADIGIIGENVLIEKGFKLRKAIPLGFSKCRVSIALPTASTYSSIQDLSGLKIATSYPNTLAQFLSSNNIQAETHVISGSVEIAPNIGLADGICDIVSSGNTLFKNNLKEVEVISKSQAWLVTTPELSKTKNALFQQLKFRLESILLAKEYQYLLLNAPDKNLNEIINILPGMKSPTVMPLATKGWNSIHTVIKKDGFWAIIATLKNLGAEGILINPIEKMIL